MFVNFLGNTDCSSNKPYQSFLPGEGRCFPRFMAVTEVRAWVSGAWAANKREEFAAFSGGTKAPPVAS